MPYTLPDKYKKMSEAEITTALADKNDGHILQELACLIDIYSKQVARLLERGGKFEDALHPPACPFEKIALKMVVDAAKADAAKGA
jgi:hypothetical protein